MQEERSTIWAKSTGIWLALRKAIESHEQALAIAREVKNRATEANALNYLGIVFTVLSLRESN